MTIVIESIDEVQIFINQNNKVTIIQKSQLGDDDSVVEFPVSYIDTIINALMRMKSS